MEKFEIQRDYYLLQIKALIYSNDWIDMLQMQKNPELLKAVLYPTNKEELSYAKSFLSFYFYTKKVIDDSSKGNLERIDLDNSILIDYYTTGVNAIAANKTDKELKEQLTAFLYKDDITYAHVAYEYLNFIFQDYDPVLDKLASSCGFDLNDLLDMAYFDKYIEKLTMISEEVGLEIFNDKEKFENMSIEFKHICENKKDNKKLILD